MKIENEIAHAVINELNNLLDYYTADEMEETLFTVFQSAVLHTDFPQDEKERQAALHNALRAIFKTISTTDHGNHQNIAQV